MTISTFLKKNVIATLDELIKELGVSARSVLRKLCDEGYYTSYTHNSRYYTLMTTPKFDRNRIWVHKGVGFTNLNNLMDLVVHCIDRCPMGYSVPEASELLQTNVANQLGILLRGGRVKRVRYTDGYVYFSLDPILFQKQLFSRKKNGQEPLPLQTDPLVSLQLICGLSHEIIVCILGLMINCPQYSLKQIREALLKQKIKVEASDLERLVETQELKRYKKKEYRLISLLLEHLSAIKGEDRWFDESKKVLFAPRQQVCPICNRKLESYKTQDQTIYSVHYGNFTAKVQYRYCPGHAYDLEDSDRVISYRSEALAAIIGPSKRYAYDVMTYVGISRFLQARQLEEIRDELFQKYKIPISLSQISKLSEEFLIYLSCLHASYQIHLKRLIDKQGGYYLHLDSSYEGQNATILVGIDSVTGWVLVSEKIPSERESSIVPALKKLKQLYGVPQGIMRDMSQAFKNASGRVFPKAPQRICHFHFLKDIGKDILDSENQQIRSLMIQEKVGSQLNSLRRDLIEPLRSCKLDMRVIEEIATGCKELDRNSFGKIKFLLLISLTDWILNYGQDCSGLGFPFDSSWVYFYERCKIAYDLVLKLQITISSSQFKDAKLDIIVFALARVCDSAYESATSLSQLVASYKTKQVEFNKLRHVLRFYSEGKCAPLSQKMGYSSVEEIKAANKELTRYRDGTRARIEKARQSEKGFALKTIVEHLDRHWNYLIVNGKGPRTNNEEEGLYRDAKRKLRRLSGRKSIAQEFKRLGAYIPLVQNLEKASYIEAVIGSLDNLAEAFANLAPELIEKHKEDFYENYLGVAHKARKALDPVKFLNSAFENVNGKSEP